MVKNTTILAILPLVIGAITLPIPDFSMFYMWVVLILYVPVLLFAVYLDITGKSKSKKLRGYSSYFSMLVTSIYFALPAIKLYHERPVMQVLIIGIWAGVSYLTFRYNRVMHAVVFAESDRYRKFTFLLHGTMGFALIAGGGGYYKAAEYLSYAFGQNATFAYFSFILLIGSLWLGIFVQSTVGVFTKFR